MDLTAITAQTIESRHVFDVHLGKTVVPYATLEPLKAALPFRPGHAEIPSDDDGPGGVDLNALDRRMRGRWRIISEFWENNKSTANRLDFPGQLDYMRKLSAQLGDHAVPEINQVRLAYTSAGQPTSAIVRDANVIINYKPFWMVSRTLNEANYLLAIINSDVLAAAVAPLMSKGQFGARDLQKHLWKLPIPEFDAGNPLHLEISQDGAAAAGVAQQLAQLREERDKLTVTIVRREIRKWLRESEEGKPVEDAVGRLLAGGQRANQNG